MAERRKSLNLSGVAQKKREGRKPAVSDTPTTQKPPRGGDLFDTEKSDSTASAPQGEVTPLSEEDEELFSSVPKKGTPSKWLFVIVGVLAVAAVIIGFLLFGGGSEDAEEPESLTGQTPPVSEPAVPGLSPDEEQTGEEEPAVSPSVGSQNFAGNTTMDQNSPLVDPELYLKDIFGLTMQVNYTVQNISHIADFVSYEKHRGTWGGGMELHWLDVEYKGNQYVIQVPFRYYKELDDKGIIPVKMEVLTVDGPKNGQTLTVISYMCLDEEVLSAILATQSK